jgi:ferritin
MDIIKYNHRKEIVFCYWFTHHPSGLFLPCISKYMQNILRVMAPAGKQNQRGIMNPKLEEAINEQINAELYSAYLYLSMSSWFDSTGLKGFAHWERIQAMEERDHALKFFDYVCARGGRVIMKQIAAPPISWKTPQEAFETQLNHELKVTDLINTLVNLAMGEKDHATVQFLQWFVGEQVEEEENARTILDQLKMISQEKGVGLLYMLDKEMGTRIYTPPVQASP